MQHSQMARSIDESSLKSYRAEGISHGLQALHKAGEARRGPKEKLLIETSWRGWRE